MSTQSKNTKKSSNTSITSTPASPATTPTAISSADAARCQELLDEVDAILGPVTQLSSDDIRRSLKLRKGGAQVVTDLVALCNHHGITSVGPITPGSMSSQKARADTLHQIGVHFAAVGKKLSDATFSADSNTWQQATALYTVLQRLAVIDPTLAQGIQPVQAFFQTKATKGTIRATKEKRKLVAAQDLLAKQAGSTPTAGAPPAAAPPASATGDGSSAVASSGVSAAPPAVPAPTAANGVAHS